MGNKRTSIYIQDELAKEEQIAKEKSVSFSQRINDIAVRYNILLQLETLPEFNDSELQALKNIFSKDNITPLKIKYLDDEVLFLELQDEKLKIELIEKIKNLNYIQRMKLLEEFDI